MLTKPRMQNAMTLRYAIVLLVALMAATPPPAIAKCGVPGNVDYSDVSAVMFERRGCGGFLAAPSPKPACSSYWLFVSDSFDSQYSKSKGSGTGTFATSVSLDDVRHALESHDFYRLNPPDNLVSDMRQSVLTVKRCSVVTRIMAFPGFESDPEVAALFSEIDLLVERSEKRRISADPLPFRYVSIFDGR